LDDKKGIIFIGLFSTIAADAFSSQGDNCPQVDSMQNPIFFGGEKKIGFGG
jgi:hypothetical protein